MKLSPRLASSPEPHSPQAVPGASSPSGVAMISTASPTHSARSRPKPPAACGAPAAAPRAFSSSTGRLARCR